jgi:predicted molibdopterin-dependent oxidoreductase YjgC
VLWSVGGNFLEVMPDPDRVSRSLERVPLRVHQDIVLSSQMLVPGDDVLLLPATTRYEVPGGVTETSTERRIILSGFVPNPRVPDARPEWDVLLEVARRIKPDLRLGCEDSRAIRQEISRVVPMYGGIERLETHGDSLQYGGRRLLEGGAFQTDDGLGHFSVFSLEREALPDGMFRLSTRRGKQFNSMVHESKDSLNGAARDAVLISGDDASKIGLRDGETVTLRSTFGTYTGRAFMAKVKPGNLQVHWPEGNVLLDAHKRSKESHVPDYNAFVTLERGA